MGEQRESGKDFLHKLDMQMWSGGSTVAQILDLWINPERSCLSAVPNDDLGHSSVSLAVHDVPQVVSL